MPVHTVFNVVINSIVWAWCRQTVIDITAAFYVDDGHIAGTNAPILQESLDLLVDLFSQIGLKMNASKTKAWSATMAIYACSCLLQHTSNVLKELALPFWNANAAR